MHFSLGFPVGFCLFHSGRPLFRPRRPPGRGPGVRQKPLKTAPAGAKCLEKTSKVLKTPPKPLVFRKSMCLWTPDLSIYLSIYMCVSRGDSSAAAASPGDRWGGQQKAAKCVGKAPKTARFPQNARQKASRNAPRGPTGAASLSKRASWDNRGNCTFLWDFLLGFVFSTQAGRYFGPAGRPAGAPELGKNP